jgi:hypothetical protein
MTSPFCLWFSVAIFACIEQAWHPRKSKDYSIPFIKSGFLDLLSNAGFRSPFLKVNGDAGKT